MKVSFIATVYNEESSVGKFLQSLFSQSKLPDEIIIVDGGSTDKTVSGIKHYASSIDKEFRGIKLKVLIKKGNRSVGRNKAIKQAVNDIIVCSDAGCILDKDWVRNIAKPFENPKIDVVAGYYKGSARTIFEKCLIPYVLVMSDRVKAKNFLPASRSMAFRKSIWRKAGGFPKEYSNNEDYVFAKRLRKNNANIVFEKRSIVYWTPRSNIKDAFIMFYRFAKGDAESRIFRPKVLLIFLRYIIAFTILFLFLFLKLNLILNTLCLLLFVYVAWAISKNYRYVNNWKALYLLPEIQIVSDVAILSGTIAGFSNKR